MNLMSSFSSTLYGSCLYHLFIIIIIIAIIIIITIAITIIIFTNDGYH